MAKRKQWIVGLYAFLVCSFILLGTAVCVRSAVNAEVLQATEITLGEEETPAGAAR